MPGLDKTGPMGQGSKTGRKLGNCKSENEPLERGTGRGLGLGRGRAGAGRGAGRGRGGAGRGRGLQN